jgi:hypothetical protein
MRKTTKYHHANGIVQVLKMRKKAWIALRLHLDNIFNLLAWNMTTRNTPPEDTAASQSVKKKKRERRGKTGSEFVWSYYLAKKGTLVSITADAAPSRSRIFKGLLANASAVTDDKQNVFAYAATDEKENDHYWSRAHLPGAELGPLSFACAATDHKDADRSPDFNEYWSFRMAIEIPKKDKEDLAKSSYEREIRYKYLIIYL